MKIKLVLGLILFLLVANCIRLYILQSEKYLNLTCESTVHFTDNSHGNDFLFNGTIIFDFEKSRNGYFYLSGTTGNKLEKYDFSRYIKFEYKHEESNRYSVKIANIQKMGHDTVPDSFVPVIYSELNIADKPSLFISRSNENLLTLGTIVSPLLNCVQKS
ncbi:TPA: hypothetical protein ACRX1T_003597 [Klebsiella pneumoniae]|uniref:hypothetical protein n=1 Tax=Klebsiella pneumoniae TaxID=573 RepID=UPI0025A04F73|nr:hypothetical protein [Klebsiella pneumoniae]MDM7429588.1 hypothetical protein [Klebsiella pneumoniae]